MKSPSFCLLLGLTLCLGLPLPPGDLLAAEPTKKVVFISGKPSHGPMAHEHRAGNILLAKALTEAKLGFEPVVLPEDGYPKDASVLDDAATIVVFCTGHQGHLLNPKLDEFDALMKKGTGVVMVHWATEAMMGKPGKKFLEWMGGYCALDWSVNPHWTPKFTAFPDHPVANGLTPFSINDEWYYHMRFVSDLEGVTPILSAVPGPDTLKRPDGPRSGNPHVRKAVANGESQHVAWAYQRPGEGKGRGFGFTGAHNHVSWQNDNFRKVVLNAIAWTAHVEVPKKGISSTRPTDEEIKQNLDDKGQRRRAPKKPPEKPKPKTSSNAPKPAPKIQELDEVRRQNVETMNTREALHMLVQALNQHEDARVREALMKGILEGLEGQRELEPPVGWGSLRAKLATSPSDDVRNLTDQLSQLFGDEEATQRALASLKDTSQGHARRAQALASLLTQQRAELLPILAQLLEEEALRIPAIRAYSVFESDEAPRLLLKEYPAYPADAQRAVIETLATRKSYAKALFHALESGTIAAEALPAYVARSLSALLGDKFSRSYGVKALSADKEALMDRYHAMATPTALAKADASSGRLVYENICGACHKMYGEGGIVGPDLTGSNRADLNYLLLNVFDPSGDIPDAYKLVTITTKGGQVLAGSVTEEDAQRVVLSMVGQQSVIAKNDIRSREIADVSMMPEGILEPLKQSEVLDLFKYLQTKEQVDLPKE